MYLFLGYDGQLVQAYDGFDVNNPDWAKLQNVKEVLYVGKAYEKQMKLVVKAKEERIAIVKHMEAHNAAKPEPKPEQPKRRGRKKQ